MDLTDKTVLVVGLGASGKAAARLLQRRGAQVIGNDVRDSIEGSGELIAQGIELALGSHEAELFRAVDLIVLSPGVPPLPALEAADEAGVPVLSEIELASRFVSGTIVAITGTNGKSTVTSLVGEMAALDARPSFVGGNLGTPLVDVIDTPAAGPDGLVVVELSSFQLERVHDFAPHVAALLNVSEDHLDRYTSYADYVAAKGRIFRRQKRADLAVVPSGDEVCMSLARAGSAEIRRFGSGGYMEVRDGAISGFDVALPVSEMKLRGGHNHDNACAAALIARLVDIEVAHVEKVLREFPGLPHRMQHVADIEGVRFYDDSKATNVGAAVAALRGFDGERVVWIAGGKDKGGSYSPLGEPLKAVARAVVTLGHAAPRIEEELGDIAPLQRVADLGEAVKAALDMAEPGDAVLLAPACSSFDMFRSYVERGEVFQSEVQRLASTRGGA